MTSDYIQENRSMMHVIETSILGNWDCPAYSDYDSDTRFTYAQVASEIARLHTDFSRRGLKEGDRIALCDRNSSRWGVAFMAAFTYGAVVVPILPDFSGEQIRHILVHSEARLLICGASILRKLGTEEVGNKAEDEDKSGKGEANGSEGDALPCPAKDLQEIGCGADFRPCEKSAVRYPVHDAPDALAMLCYTSGSTGHSKGVMIPYRAIWSNTAFADECLKVPMRSRFLSLLPLAHMYGFAFEFMYAFCIGAHVTFLTKTPSPTILLQALAQVRPYVLISVPLIIEKIVRGRIFPALRTAKMRALLSLPIVRGMVYRGIRNRLLRVFGGQLYEVIVGGAAFSGEVEEFLKRIRFPFTVGYGMTECAPIISYSDWHTFQRKSCGRPVPRMEIRVLSTDPRRVAGEIVTRGTNVMLGYYKDAESTGLAIDADGWLHTGDLGTMDADGNLFIRGRSKNMLLGANGQNIYPEEIEEKFTTHTLIDECVVVQRGEKLVALVYVSPDTLRRHGMSREEWLAQLDHYRTHVNSLLPAFDSVSRLEPREEEFEKTPKRNIRRFLYS